MQKNFIFNEKNGKLEFIGDFESFYQNNDDPWGQSGKSSSLMKYYASSRKKLLQQISSLPNNKDICELGCGLGYVTSFLNENLPGCIVDGIDISHTAIKKANNLFPYLNFTVGNICSNDLTIIDKQYDVVILNQILWYILKDLCIVFDNINKLLKQNGYLIISTLFLKNQRYGNEIIGSFDGLINYCFLHHKNTYRIIFADIDYTDENSDYKDSILVLQKIT